MNEKNVDTLHLDICKWVVSVVGAPKEQLDFLTGSALSISVILVQLCNKVNTSNQNSTQKTDITVQSNDAVANVNKFLEFSKQFDLQQQFSVEDLTQKKNILLVLLVLYDFITKTHAILNKPFQTSLTDSQIQQLVESEFTQSLKKKINFFAINVDRFINYGTEMQQDFTLSESKTNWSLQLQLIKQISLKMEACTENPSSVNLLFKKTNPYYE